MTNTASYEATVPISLTAYDAVTAKVSQLHALLSTISGEGCEGFDSLNDIIKYNIIWLANDLSGAGHKALVEPTPVVD